MLGMTNLSVLSVQKTVVRVLGKTTKSFSRIESSSLARSISASFFFFPLAVFFPLFLGLGRSSSEETRFLSLLSEDNQN